MLHRHIEVPLPYRVIKKNRAYIYFLGYDNNDFMISGPREYETLIKTYQLIAYYHPTKNIITLIFNIIFMHIKHIVILIITLWLFLIYFKNS